MSNTRIINESDKHYVVRSLEVLEGIKGAGISSIRNTIQTLQNAQQSLAQETQDYWSAAADDSMVSPEEKKMLYKEWQHLLDEYASLIQAAGKAQVPENSGTLAAYKNAYTQLYDYIIQRLKLFDDMTRATQLPDRRAFIDLYTTYYAMRDALRDTISLTQLAEGNADVIPPDRVTGLAVYAEEHIITLSWNALGDGLRNTLKQYAVTVKKAGSTEYITAGAVTGNRFTYVFNRQLDGYPEKDELAKWSFKVTAVNIFNKSGMAAEKTVNTDAYGTWIPKEPIIVKRESNRQITLYLSEPEHVYGDFRYKIQIKKVADAQWYKPATSGDYLASENAYKAGDGWETVSQLFSQTLPLEGQNAVEPLPVDTTYLYRVTAYNETGKEATGQIEVIAHATGVRDIVAAAITNNKLAPGAVTADKIHAGTITSHELYTGDLAAGGASFGKISAGGKGLHADKNNFWDLENQEFRIGNDIALENSGSDDAEYLHYKKDRGIFFKLKNFIVSSISSTILGIFRVKGKGDTDANSFLVVNPTNTKDDVTQTDGKRVKVGGAVQCQTLSTHHIATPADTIKNYYYIDLRAYPTDTFYPIVFPLRDTYMYTVDGDISSQAFVASAPYNCNRLNFSWLAPGWSDMYPKLTITNYGCYDRNEITILGFAEGKGIGSRAIYVRGGVDYYMRCTSQPYLKTEPFDFFIDLPYANHIIWKPIKTKSELTRETFWVWLAEDGAESTYVNSVRTPAARVGNLTTDNATAGALTVTDKANVKSLSITNNGWKATLQPCADGVELVIYGGDGGLMQKKQLWTTIAGGLMNLFVLGSITSCGNIYHGNTGAITNGWTKKTSGVTHSLSAIACNGNTWVAVSGNSEIIASTDNGNTWTTKPSGVTQYLTGIACNGNTWVVVGHNGVILVSTDNGNTWTKKTSGVTIELSAIAYNGNTWVAVGNNGTVLASTDNGNTWTTKPSGVTQYITGIACNGNTWVAVSVHGTVIASTDNGNTWTKKTSGVTYSLSAIACNGNTWVAVSGNGAIIASTDNGNTWTKKTSGVTIGLDAIAYNSNTWVAVGVHGTVIASTDTSL